MSDANDFLKPDSGAVMKHIDMYQGIINRMAGNSAECKKWAVTLVSAILVVVAKDGINQAAILAGIPIILFCFLDTYYLALEKQFRAAYNSFLNDLHNGVLTVDKLYKVITNGKLPRTFLEALLSLAVWPFYLGMLGLVALAKWLADNGLLSGCGNLVGIN
ncbi:hypothetical protein VSS37_18790 [Candidatus Thiothrix sp. Deng01]|uniref:Uncharacterized protein n=1 Tax=Candidatus Thiothrix phosphatis TaxID=3112415 RepID=A0ABU6D1U5_9GAMM|nr:hypothetical protein [Candidatus Thiothrix sp. Deng01]MEB4593034.1 hypothetical protein [Candidatus Thiothrix sp. Deng01]